MLHSRYSLTYDYEIVSVVIDDFILSVNAESLSFTVPHQVNDCIILQLAYIKWFSVHSVFGRI